MDVRLIRADQLPAHEPRKPTNTAGVTFRFNRKALSLEMLDKYGSCYYDIDLECCTDSAGLLDYILQIALKSHPMFAPAVVGDLICALEDAAFENFGTNLQGLYCPFGKSQKVDWRKRKRKARRPPI